MKKLKKEQTSHACQSQKQNSNGDILTMNYECKLVEYKGKHFMGNSWNQNKCKTKGDAKIAILWVAGTADIHNLKCLDNVVHDRGKCLDNVAHDRGKCIDNVAYDRGKCQNFV